MTLLCLRGLMMSGQRGVVVSSWSDMSVELLEGEPDSAELIAYAKEKARGERFALGSPPFGSPVSKRKAVFCRDF